MLYFLKYRSLSRYDESLRDLFLFDSATNMPLKYDFQFNEKCHIIASNRRAVCINASRSFFAPSSGHSM